MELTCAQMDILISFYIENELSQSLQKQVKQHLESCPICSAKYDIIENMLSDLKHSLKVRVDKNTPKNEKGISVKSEQYRFFKNNLSAYIDNELPSNENIRIKKYTINNLLARKDLEDSYNIRKLMNDSFRKIKEDSKTDFSKNILRKLELDEETAMNFHPAVRFLVVFTISVLILSTIVLVSLNL